MIDFLWTDDILSDMIGNVDEDTLTQTQRTFNKICKALGVKRNSNLCCINDNEYIYHPSTYSPYGTKISDTLDLYTLNNINVVTEALPVSGAVYLYFASENDLINYIDYVDKYECRTGFESDNLVVESLESKLTSEKMAQLFLRYLQSHSCDYTGYSGETPTHIEQLPNNCYRIHLYSQCADWKMSFCEDGSVHLSAYDEDTGKVQERFANFQEFLDFWSNEYVTWTDDLGQEAKNVINDYYDYNINDLIENLVKKYL